MMSNSEVMQMLQTAAFARYALGRDSPNNPSLATPPLRPKRAASGVAGPRYGSGQRKTNHALISEASAGNLSPKLFPLTYR